MARVCTAFRPLAFSVMIPLANDTRETIGDFADKVENRSLLFEKMVLAKTWGHEARFDDANRFNVLRASSEGATLLEEDRESAQRRASSPRARDDAKEQAAYKAKVAGALAKAIRVDSDELARRQVENANQLLGLVERAYHGRVKTFVGTLGGRMLINMAGGVMENAGIALDRCFGLPYIPGSAVKGIARNAALWDIRRSNDRNEKLAKLRRALLAFGFIRQDIRNHGYYRWAAGGDELIHEALGKFSDVTEFKGLLSFLPAKPASTRNLTIVAEVNTPHPGARDGAQGRGNPRPLFFPAVEAGSSFGFAVLAQRQVDGVVASEVLASAVDWLQEAITGNGVGAKTGSGYGWFEIDIEAEARRREEMEQAEAAAAKKEEERALAEKAKAEEEARLASLSPHDLAMEEIGNLSQQEFAEYAKSLADKEESQQRAFLEVLGSTNHKKDRKRWKKMKPELWDSLKSVAANLNMELA